MAINSDISIFDNHLMNGLLFCKRVYNLFANIRNSPDGIKKLRLRKGKIEKKLIEELIPIARYVQAHYSPGRQLKVRWVDGDQHYDAMLLSTGPMVEKRLVPKRQFVEVTTAVNENDHFLRKLIDENGVVFSVKVIKLKQTPKKIVSNPYVYINDEAQNDLTNSILERIEAKSVIDYPQKTVLVIQCFLDILFLQDEWDDSIKQLRKALTKHKFYEIFIFDSNYHYTAIIYGKVN